MTIILELAASFMLIAASAVGLIMTIVAALADLVFLDMGDA